jgi:hypothetical protein
MAGERVLINFFYAHPVGHFAARLRAHHGDASAIWSIGGIHAGYL